MLLLFALSRQDFLLELRGEEENKSVAWSLSRKLDMYTMRFGSNLSGFEAAAKSIVMQLFGVNNVRSCRLTASRILVRWLFGALRVRLTPLFRLSSGVPSHNIYRCFPQFIGCQPLRYQVCTTTAPGREASAVKNSRISLPLTWTLCRGPWYRTSSPRTSPL